MAGLLDFIKTPEGQGLLAATFGGLAGARRGQPLNSIGRAGLAGLTGFGAAQDRIGEAETRAQNNELRGLQVDAYKQSQATARQKQEMEEAQRVESARIKQILPQLFAPSQRQQNQMPMVEGGGGQFKTPMLGDVPMFSQGMDAPQKFNMPMRGGEPEQGFDIQGAVREAIRQGVPTEMIEKFVSMQNLGRPKVARTVDTVDAQGRPTTMQLDEFGQPVGQAGGMPQWKAPVSVNQGDRQTYIDPVTLKPVGSFAVNETPDGRASRAVTVRGQNMTDARARERLVVDQSQAALDGGGPGQSMLAKQFGKPPAGFRWKPDGSMEFIPGGPADQKAQLQKSGEGTVGTVVADLRDRYSKLQEGGGIVESGGGTVGNIGAFASSTGVGQTFGSMFGTKNQGERDSIAMTRPLLLQAIMRATGMSAKQMDSNAELKLYLATATDPTKGLQANMGALERIETLYGGGGASTPKPAPAPGAAPASIPPSAASHLKMNPSLRADFDKKYGPGAAASILGK